MKRALVFLLLLFAFSAQAAPTCIPGLYGTQYPGSVFNDGERSDDGWFSYQWCLGKYPDGRVGPSPTYKACVHGVDCQNWDKIGATVGTLISQAVNGATKEKVFSDYYAANPPKWRCGFEFEKNTEPVASTPAQIRVCAQLKARMTQDWPKDVTPPASQPPTGSTHYVKANGATPTRPAYAVVNGVRGTKEVSRATVGQPCKTAEGSPPDMWAEFGPAFAPGVVALCALKK